MQVSEKPSAAATPASPESPAAYTSEFLAASRALEREWRARFEQLAKKFGVDPAVSSTVFLTMVTDVIGFLTFLGLATIFLL